ncbi:MAG: hypothetical protein GY720_00725 [bacterium]|nr:hypothetical protein [bacterium]
MKIRRSIVGVAFSIVWVVVFTAGSASAQDNGGASIIDDEVKGVDGGPVLYSWDVPTDFPADCEAIPASYVPQPGTRVQLGLADKTADDTHVGQAWGSGANIWQFMNWWQWSPQSPSGPGIHTDAYGDTVCQSGRTANAKWCGVLSHRYHAYTDGATGSNFTNQRISSTHGCPGDSGGTIFRDSDKTLTGIVSASNGSSTFFHNGQLCHRSIKYSHTGYLKPHFGLKAPIGMF